MSAPTPSPVPEFGRLRPERTPAGLTPGLRVGDDAAWKTFRNLYGKWILGIARREGLSPEDAEDVLQDVMIRIHLSIHLFRRDNEKSTFQGWIHRVALNRVRDVQRARARNPLALALPDPGVVDAVPDPGDPDFDLALRPEAFRDLRGLVESMAREHFRGDSWTVFEQAVLEGVTLDEIVRRGADDPRSKPLSRDTARKRVERVKIWLGTLRANSLFHDEWTRYRLRNSPRPGELRS